MVGAPEDAGDRFVSALTPAERSALQRMSREALQDHLKAHGLTKMGQRMKVESALRRDVKPTTATCAGFVAASQFEGARPGMVFKIGDDGLGYYRDAKPQDKMSKGFRGNLSWLSQEATDAATPAEPAPAPAATPAADPSPQQRPYQIKPFEPVLYEGKFAEVGHMIQLVEGQHRGKWGKMVGCQHHMINAVLLSGQPVDSLDYRTIKTTQLKEKEFLRQLEAHQKSEELRQWASDERNYVPSAEYLRGLEQTFGGSALRLGYKPSAEDEPPPMGPSRPPQPLKVIKRLPINVHRVGKRADPVDWDAVD